MVSHLIPKFICTLTMSDLNLPRRLDWIGTVLILCVATCALLALQWGGTMYKWNSGVIIGLLCTFVALLGIFIAWEHALGSRALLPFQILKRRTQYGACLEASWLLMAMITAIYYLPLWYQINGRTPIQSGIDILPFMLSFVVGSTLSATLTFITGRYWHVLVTTPLLGCVGAGLLFSVDAQTSSARLLGYQIILGVSSNRVYRSFCPSNEPFSLELASFCIISARHNDTNFIIGMSFQTTYVSVQVRSFQHGRVGV